MVDVNLSLRCAQGFHVDCGVHLLNRTTCECWCHQATSDGKECRECLGLGSLPLCTFTESLTRPYEEAHKPCPTCNGTGRALTQA